MRRYSNNGKTVWGTSRPDSFPNGASRRQHTVHRCDQGGFIRSTMEDSEFDGKFGEEPNNEESVNLKLDRLLDWFDKFDLWRDETDRRFENLEPCLLRSGFEDGDDWEDDGNRRRRSGDRVYRSRNSTYGNRDDGTENRGHRESRNRVGSGWEQQGTRHSRNQFGGYDQSFDRPASCWDPPWTRRFNEDHGGRHSTAGDSPWGRGDSGRQRPLLSTATTVASQPLLGFDGRSSRATHQPLSSEALWWDRYESGGEGVRGRRPIAWDNEGGRYSDPPGRIDASERRAAIAQPPPRPDRDPPDTDWQRGREESERQRAVLTPAPAVASIPRLGFGDDSSIRGPQQATQPGASSGASYTVKGDGDRGKQPSASVAIKAPSSSNMDLLLQVKDLSAVIDESLEEIVKTDNTPRQVLVGVYDEKIGEGLETNNGELEKDCSPFEEMKLNEKRYKELAAEKGVIEKELNDAHKNLAETSLELEGLANEKILILEEKSGVDGRVRELGSHAHELRDAVVKLEGSNVAYVDMIRNLESQVGEYKSKLEKVYVEREGVERCLDEEKQNALKLIMRVLVEEVYIEYAIVGHWRLKQRPCTFTFDPGGDASPKLLLPTIVVAS